MSLTSHLIRTVFVLLISALGSVAAIALPMDCARTDHPALVQHLTDQSPNLSIGARAPPLNGEHVAFTGDVTVVHGGAFVTHDVKTQWASLNFDADLVATNKTPIETSTGALVRPADSPNYSVATEVQLPSSAYPGVSRRRHNQMSNQALHEAFEADPSYAAQMERLYPGIIDGVRPGPRGAFSRDAPTSDVTWHHGTEPGQMQLVPVEHHTAPGPVQGTLHPGPNGGGGFADWGTE